jgi:ribosomal-protein-alanine N-acetyltransferase
MVEADLAAVAAAEQLIHPFPWTLGNFRDSLASGDRAWVWETDGLLQGYGMVNQVLDEAQLLNISIQPDLQGQGLGTRLLHFLCDDARQHRAARLFLEVRPSNGPARALYERFGFKIIGQRKGYYPAAEGREDAIVMELML